MKKNQRILGYVYGWGLGILALAWILMLGNVLVSAADKVKSDKERISILEKQVDALNEQVSDQGAWEYKAKEYIEVLNERTWDLNKRLQQVENRGPVAKRGYKEAVLGEKR